MSATVKTSLRDLQQGLTLRPLVFEKETENQGEQDSHKDDSFVKPYYIKKDEPPITIGDVKELKTYLKMIMRCESSYYKGKNKLRSVFNRKKTSPNDRLKELRATLKKDNPPGTLPKLGGAGMTKKQLKKDAKEARKKARSSADGNSKEYAEYLELLLRSRQVRGGFELDKLKQKAEKKVRELVATMNLSTETMSKLIPANLRGYLEEADHSQKQSKESSLWTKRLKDAMAALEEVSKKYDKLAKEKYEAITKEYEELEKQDAANLDGKKNLTKDEMNYDDMGSVGDQKALTENYCKRLGKLIQKFRQLTQEIEPFAEKLFANAAKAKVYGLDTLYTKLSDKLQGSSDKLEAKIAEMYDKQSEMIAISTGLDRLTRNGGDKLQNNTSWTDILATINGINRGFEKCAVQLKNRHLYRDNEELAKKLERLTGQITDLVDEGGTIRSAITKTNASRTNLNAYNLRVLENLEKAEADMAEYTAAYDNAKTLLDTAGKTVVGKLLLFKEKHKTTLKTLEALRDVASTLKP